MMSSDEKIEDNIVEMNEDVEIAETVCEYSFKGGHHSNIDSDVASGSGLGKLVVHPKININYSIQTTNPTAQTGNISQTLNIGEKLVQEFVIPSNEATDHGGQSSKPLPKERKRKYDYDGPPLSDEEEEKKRLKAKKSSLWRKNNLKNDVGNRENTTFRIEIEPSLSTCHPTQVNIAQQVALQIDEIKRSNHLINSKLLGFLVELRKQYPRMNDSQYVAFAKALKLPTEWLSMLNMQVSNQGYVEHQQPEQENTHSEQGNALEPINEVCKLQVEQHGLEVAQIVKEFEKLKQDKKELEHKCEEFELENKKLKEREGQLEHDKEDLEQKYENYKIMLEQEYECEKQQFEQDKMELEQKYEQRVSDNDMLRKEIVSVKQDLKKLKDENKLLMKKRLEFYVKTYDVNLVEKYFKQD